MLVCFVTSARNAASHLDECCASVLSQTHAPLEWCVYDDGSSDDTRTILESWRPRFYEKNIALRVVASDAGSAARGCGYGRNRAVEESSSASVLLVVLDADDKASPSRAEALLAASLEHPDALIGSRYTRVGPGRPREFAWHNSLSTDGLILQQLRETTMARSSINKCKRVLTNPAQPVPTWAFTRAVYEAAGRFAEDSPNSASRWAPHCRIHASSDAEDLIFFYAHLNLGRPLWRVDDALLHYRHTDGGVVATRGVPSSLIWTLRVAQLEHLLARNGWLESGFTIWNAGKGGRALYNSLSPAARHAVRGFADVDAKKLARDFDDLRGRFLPIVHFAAAKPPLLLCVKLGLTDGVFEENLASLHLTEGRDYLHFS